MNWGAIAAFTAAGLSALNILISYRLAHRGQLEQWRREQERPIVARLLTLSAEAYTAWTDVAIMKQNSAPGSGISQPSGPGTIRERYDIAVELWKTLRYEVAQLDLVAGTEVRKAADKLINIQEGLRYRLNPNGPGVTVFRTGEENKVNDLPERLTEVTRADLGLPSRGWKTYGLRSDICAPDAPDADSWQRTRDSS